MQWVDLYNFLEVSVELEVFIVMALNTFKYTAMHITSRHYSAEFDLF